MAPLDKRRIADRYMPSQWHYWYSLSKLTLDPLYENVGALLERHHSPVLDVGCGIGLMLHYLRVSGVRTYYKGVDIDAAKIEIARRTTLEMDDVEFEVRDLANNFPAHLGSVVLLDVLQYLQPEAQDDLLRQCSRCLTPDAVLIIRGGLDDGSFRAALTRATDRLGHALRWMSSSFKAQPKPAHLHALLEQQGLQVEFRKPAPHLPFNNWLIVARRAPRTN
jgi:SAM-dependent methyltransferase